jgi:hypothetical protein
MIFWTPSIGRLPRAAGRGVSAGAGRAAPGAACAVSVTSADATPGSALILLSTADRKPSIALARAGSTLIARNTLPSRMVTPSIAPDCGSGVRPSGPGIAASAAMTSSFESIG